MNLVQACLCFQEYRDPGLPVVDQARATKATESKKLVEDYAADPGCFFS